MLFCKLASNEKFFSKGQNPYSTETTREIQEAINTYFIEKSETEYRFSLPLYGIILYSPFALIKNFAVARALWMTVLEIGILAIILLSIRVTNWKAGNTVVFSLVLFAFFGFHGIIPLVDGNIIILIALLVICILYAIANHHDEAAGILLGFLTISLSSVILFVIYLLFWVIANHRNKVIVWFLGTFWFVDRFLSCYLSKMDFSISI